MQHLCPAAFNSQYAQCCAGWQSQKHGSTAATFCSDIGHFIVGSERTNLSFGKLWPALFHQIAEGDEFRAVAA